MLKGMYENHIRRVKENSYFEVAPLLKQCVVGVALSATCSTHLRLEENAESVRFSIKN